MAPALPHPPASLRNRPEPRIRDFPGHGTVPAALPPARSLRWTPQVGSGEFSFFPPFLTNSSFSRGVGSHRRVLPKTPKPSPPKSPFPKKPKSFIPRVLPPGLQGNEAFPSFYFWENPSSRAIPGRIPLAGAGDLNRDGRNWRSFWRLLLPRAIPLGKADLIPSLDPTGEWNCPWRRQGALTAPKFPKIGPKPPKFLCGRAQNAGKGKELRNFYGKTMRKVKNVELLKLKGLKSSHRGRNFQNQGKRKEICRL